MALKSSLDMCQSRHTYVPLPDLPIPLSSNSRYEKAQVERTLAWANSS